MWILRDEATDFMSSLVSGVYACHHVWPSKDGNLGAGGGGACYFATLPRPIDALQRHVGVGSLCGPCAATNLRSDRMFSAEQREAQQSLQERVAGGDRSALRTKSMVDTLNLLVTLCLGSPPANSSVESECCGGQGVRVVENCI